MIMNSALKKGQYKIKMEFRAWLTDDLAGLYKSTYKRKDGTEVYVTYINNEVTIIQYFVDVKCLALWKPKDKLWLLRF